MPRGDQLPKCRIGADGMQTGRWAVDASVMLHIDLRAMARGCNSRLLHLRGIVPNGANYAISKLTLSPRSHAPRGNAVPDAPRPRAGPKAATQSVEHGIPTRSMGTRGGAFFLEW